MKHETQKNITYCLIGLLCSIMLHSGIVILSLLKIKHSHIKNIIPQEKPSKPQPIFFMKPKPTTRKKIHISSRTAGASTNNTPSLSKEKTMASSEAPEPDQSTVPKKTILPRPPQQSLTQMSGTTPKPVATKQYKPTQAPCTKETTSKAPSKKKLSLADLSNKFMQHMQQPGNDSVTVKSSYSGPMNAADFNMLSYIRQMAQNLRTALHHVTPINIPRSSNNTKTKWSITVTRQGKIHDITIIQSCGDNNIDEHMKTITHKAAPFPPVPKCISDDLLTTHWYHYHSYTPTQNNNSIMWYR